jgi:putative acetyltransferase
VELRPYSDHDAAVTRRVFERAVGITASADYTSEQIEAWLSDSSDLLAWAAGRAAAGTIVAVDGGEVVGFGDLVQGSLLDMLYVDPDMSRRGVGSALVSEIVRLAREGGAGALETFASLTARPLFERFGFVMVEQRVPVVRGVAMTNFRMCLAL